MAQNQKLNIQIGADTIELERSLKNVNAALTNSKKEAAALKREFNSNPGNTDLLIQQQKELSQALSLSAERTKMLKDELAGVDKGVDPKAFFNLTKQIQQSERVTRSLEREINVADAAVKRLTATGSSFKLDTGSGVKEFKNSIASIDAALSTLGNVDDTITFNAAKASSKEVKAHLEKVAPTLELLTRKADLLASELDDIDINVDPKGFQKIQTELNKTRGQIAKIEKNSISIDVDQGSAGKVQGFIDNIGAQLKSGLGSIGASAAGLLSSGLEKTISTAGDIGSRIAGALMSGVSKAANFGGRLAGAIGSGVGSALSKVGGVVTRTLNAGLSGAATSVARVVTGSFSKLGQTLAGAITAPFKAVSGAIDTIVRGGLLTIGQNITNSVGRTFSGVVKSMEETSVAARSLENVLSFTGVDVSTITQIKNELNEFAKTTSFSSASLNKVVTGLSAAGVEAEKTADLTMNIAKAYALLGDGSRDVSEIGVIFSQINSANKLMAQDFNQLKDAGIGGAIKQEIERNFPEIIAEFGTFSKAMEEGAISADMVNQAISNIGSSSAAVNAATVPKTMGSAFEALNETIGQKFQNTFNNLQQYGIAAIGSITDKIDNMDFSGVAATVESLIATIRAMVSQVVGIVQQIDIGKVFSVGASVGRKSFDTLISAAQLLIDVIKRLNIAQIFDSAKAPLQFVLDGFEQLGSSITQMFRGANFEALGVGISSLMSRILVLFGTVALTLGRVFDSVNIDGLVTSVGGAFGQILEIITTFAGSQTFETSISAVFEILKSAADTVSGLLLTINEAFSSSGIDSALAGVVRWIQQMAASLASFTQSQDFKNFIGSVVGLFTELAQSAAGLNLGDIFAGIVPIFTSVINSVTNVVSSLTSALDGSGINDTLSRALGFVQQIAAGFESFTASETFKNFLGWVFSTVSGLADTVLSFNFSDIFEGVNFENIAGLLVNIGSSLLGIAGSVASIIGQLIGSVDFEGLLGNVDGIITRIKDGLSEISNAEWFSGFTTNLGGAVNELGYSVENAIGIIVSALSTPEIGEKLEDMSNSFERVTGAIRTWSDSTYLQSALTGVAQVLSSAYALIGDIAADLATVFSQTFASLDLSGLFDGLKAVIDGLKVVWDGFFSEFSASLDKLQDAGVIDGLSESFKKLGKAVSGFMDFAEPVLSFIGKLLGYFAGAIVQTAVVMIYALSEALAALLNWIVDIGKAVSKFSDKVFGFLGDIFGGIFGGSSYSALGASYSTVSASEVSTAYSSQTTNNMSFTINTTGGQSVKAIAKAIRHEFELNTA